MPPRKVLGRGLDALLSSSKKTIEPQTEVIVERGAAPPTGVREISVEKIQPNRHQPRTVFNEDALQELSDSIKKHGIAQPLIVTELSTPGVYELVMGERRLRASKMAGLSQVPCVVKKFSNRERFELALIENMQREDLNGMEQALALDGLMKEYDLTQEDVAKTLGISRSAVANVLRFLRLHESVQSAIREQKITEGHAKVLAGISEHSRQVNLLQKIVKEKMSVRALENFLSDSKKTEKASSKAAKKQTSPEVRVYEEELQRVLGRRVEIQTNGKKGWVKFAFYSPWDLDNLCQKFGINKDEKE